MIYLFLVCLCFNLISANPLAKLLLQTRPSCNQNGYSSYNLPIQANIQPYAPPIMAQNPMSCSNNQLFGPQNGLPVQIKVDDPNQSYLKKILANPVLQNIINRSNNNFNQNSQDIGLQSNPGQTPNIINNYYIVPPECLHGKDDGIEIVKKNIGDQAAACQNDEISNQRHAENKRKTLQRSQNRQHEEKRGHNGNNRRTNNQENGSKRSQNNNNSQKRKRKNGHQNQNKGNQRSNSQNMNRNENIKNHETVKIKDERNLPRKRNSTQESHPRKDGNKKRKNPKNESENIVNVQQKSNEKKSNKNDTVLNDIEGEEPHQKERRKHTKTIANYTDEVVIGDIHKKFPGIPEDVIRRLLRYLRRQLQNSCQSTQTSDSNIKSNTSHNINFNNKRRRNNQNKQRKSKNNTDLAEVTEFSSSLTTNKSLISTQSATTKETLNGQIDESTKYNNEHTTQPEIEVAETTTNAYLHTTKLEEGKILDSEHDVDDYFPDFRFDKMYMSEDEYIRSLRDNRFYYTTDRNYNSVKDKKKEDSSEIYYEPYETTKIKKDNNNEFQSHELEDTLIRPDNDNDKVLVKDYSDEEIEFQTPPILEYPDFETKPIIKYFDVEGHEFKNIDGINDKLSTYSDFKSVTTPLKYKPKTDAIETVFAKSTVAKYGQPEELEDDTNKKENSKYDDTVLVYASSFPDS